MHLRTGDIFITSKDRPWPNDPHKWYILSLKDYTCSRTRLYRGLPTKDYIVNPSSPLFNRISRILDSIEDRSQIKTGTLPWSFQGSTSCSTLTRTVYFSRLSYNAKSTTIKMLGPGTASAVSSYALALPTRCTGLSWCLSGPSLLGQKGVMLQ
ncbi:hypothetical protein LB505_005614 [Fusarium chuoi]|nr:hypothetical protein LB505_005614 [Fusarium chuoi]